MLKLLRKAWSNEFFQGSVFLTISSLIANLLNYFFNLLTGRVLGPVGFGEITALFSYITIFSVPLTVITFVIIQKLGAQEGSRYQYAKSLENWFLEKLKKLSILLLPIIVIIPFISRITNLSHSASYFLFPLLLFSIIGSIYGALAQGIHLFLGFSIVGILTLIVKLTGPILVWAGIDGLLTVLIFLLLSYFVSFVGCYLVTLKKFQQKEVINSPKINKRILNVLFHPQLITTFISILAITALNNADLIFVKKFLSPHEAGIYSSWSLFAKIILYFVGPLVGMGYIFFVHKESEKHHDKALIISLITLLITSIMAYLFYTYFSSFIIDLFFGEKFKAVIPILTQASIFGSLYTAITFLNNYFIAKKSSFALMLPTLFPFYLFFLFLIPRSISNIINLNITFAAIICTIYLVAYAHRFFYNKAHGDAVS